MTILAVNKKARFNYEIVETFVAGLVLVGPEVKSVRAGHFQIAESFVQIKDGEAFLVGSHLKPYKDGTIWNVEETRTRKLLLNKREIRQLDEKARLDGLTIVPLDCHVSANKIKLTIALARGKKNYDKRESLKRRDIDRETTRQLRQR